MNNITQILEQLRAVKDEKDTVNARLSELAATEADIERQLREFHETSGLDSVSGGGLTVSFKPQLRAAYDPDKWTSIVRWAVDTGHEYLIQRRLTDTKVAELAMSDVGLPDGLRVESHLAVSVRRK